MEDNLPVVKPVLDIGTLITQFLDAQDVAQSSLCSYKRSIRQFLLWMTDENIQNPVREDILRYKRSLEAKGMSSNSITSYIVVVRKLFAWLQDTGRYRDVARSIKGQGRVHGFRKDALSVDQVKQLLSSIDQTTITGKRDYALINTLIRTACREIELCRADVSDLIQNSGHHVLQIQGKGRKSKDEILLLTQPTYQPLIAYLTERCAKEDEPLFSSFSNRNFNGRLTTKSISRIIKTALRNIGLNSERLTGHSLRHTGITLCLSSGCSLQVASRLARHASVSTTQIYAQNLDRLRDAGEFGIDNMLA